MNTSIAVLFIDAQWGSLKDTSVMSHYQDRHFVFLLAYCVVNKEMYHSGSHWDLDT